MLLKSWRSVILLLTLVLAACGTADTSDLALSDTGVQASTTPDSPYPAPSIVPPAPTATHIPPTNTIQPTHEPTIAATTVVTQVVVDDVVNDATLSSAETILDVDQMLKDQTKVSLNITQVHNLTFDVPAIFLGWLKQDHTAFIRLRNDLYKIHLQTNQQTFLASNVYKVLNVPNTDDAIFIRTDLDKIEDSSPATIEYWSSSTSTISPVYTSTFAQLRGDAVYWINDNLIISDPMSGEVSRILIPDGTKKIVKTIPGKYQSYHFKQQILAPDEKHFFVIGKDEQQTKYSSFTLAASETNLLSMTLEANRLMPRWSPQGRYLTVSPSHFLEHLDMYTAEGKHLLRLTAHGGLEPIDWSNDETLMIVGHTEYRGTVQQASLLFNTEKQTITKLPYPEHPQPFSHTFSLSPDGNMLVRSYIFAESQDDHFNNFHSVITVYTLEQ